MSPGVRRLLTLAGGAAAAAGVGVVGWRLYDQFDRLPSLSPDPLTWLTIAAAVGVYAAAGTLLAGAWWRLLRFQGVVFAFPAVLAIYGTSQLAKYVPGNVVQFAGRQVLAMAAGMPGRAVAASAFAEIGFLVAAGCLLGVVALGSGILVVIPAGVVLGLAAAVPLLSDRAVMLAAAFLCHVCFLALAALVFLVILVAVAADATAVWRNSTLIGGAYVAAWLVGLVTPGAPSGIGVRELTLSVLLDGVVVEERLLAAIVLGRVVTMLGDLLFFLGVQPFSAGIDRR